MRYRNCNIDELLTAAVIVIDTSPVFHVTDGIGRSPSASDCEISTSAHVRRFPCTHKNCSIESPPLNGSMLPSSPNTPLVLPPPPIRPPLSAPSPPIPVQIGFSPIK